MHLHRLVPTFFQLFLVRVDLFHRVGGLSQDSEFLRLQDTVENHGCMLFLLTGNKISRIRGHPS